MTGGCCDGAGDDGLYGAGAGDYGWHWLWSWRLWVALAVELAMTGRDGAGDDGLQ